MPAAIASAGMSSARSRLRTTRCSLAGRGTGASVKPQLPMTTVVTPCQQELVPSGSQNTCASMWVWPSMKPGVTTMAVGVDLLAPARRGCVPMRAMRSAVRRRRRRGSAGARSRRRRCRCGSRGRRSCRSPPIPRGAPGSPGRPEPTTGAWGARSAPHQVDRARPRCRGGSRSRSSSVRCAACFASISCESGHVESLCGKSFAHISRRTFMRSFTWKATQSSWNVV